ncbi:MAG TPA: hypothetical protein PKL97_04990 [Candidatus Omnitrophota bacterium]|nr:hypothetical protein [Candidatus Omnitrophota bacterium]
MKSCSKKESEVKTGLIVSNDGCGRGLLAYVILRKRLPDVKFKLAGLVVPAGQALDPYAVSALRKQGLSAGAVRSVQVSDELLRKADFVVALSVENENYLRNTYEAFSAEKTMNLNIPTVIERSESAYEKTFGGINEAVSRLLSCSCRCGC